MEKAWESAELSYCQVTAVASFYKAVLYLTDARALADQHTVLAVLGTYNAIYHLGASHLLFQPEPCENDTGLAHAVRRQISKRDDLLKCVRHHHVRDHLEICASNGNMAQINDAMDELSELRNDLQYGPRLRRKVKFEFASCTYPAATVREAVARHLENSDAYLDEFLGSNLQEPWVANLLNNHRELFLVKPEGLGPYYSPETVVGASELVARHLEAYLPWLAKR